MLLDAIKQNINHLYDYTKSTVKIMCLVMLVHYIVYSAVLPPSLMEFHWYFILG